MLTIRPFHAEDRRRWEVLARGYKTFYKTTLPDDAYAATWDRLRRAEQVYGFGAALNGELVGITHYLFHANPWMPDVCYLQDLFVDEAARGQGVARALIEAVAAAAQARGVARLYWHTHHENTTARMLYNKVAQHRGFLRYDYPWDDAGLVRRG